MKKSDLYLKYSANIYYIIVFVISFITLVFLPFIGTTIGMDLRLPDSKAGWIVYIASKIIVAVINVLIFDCFMKQGKLNVKDNERYIEAKAILEKESEKEYIPISPSKWLTKQYLSKGTSIFISSIAGAFALTQAILSYDYEALIAYLFVIFMGVVFGILQMKRAEIFWTDEFYLYAKYIEKLNLKKEAENGTNIRQDNISKPRRASSKKSK